MVSKETQITFSAEKQFLHGDAFNKGFVQLPRMIVKCIGLSSEAKAVYNCLSAYIYEQGRSAFPSVSRLAIEANLTGRSIGKYLSELCELGLIKKHKRGRGRTNDYHLTDLHEIPLLHVSEMLWTALHGAVNSKKGNDWDMAYKALKAIEGAMTRNNIYYSQIGCSDEVREALQAEIISVMKGGKPTLNFIPNRPQQVRIAEVGATSKPGVADFESREETSWTTGNLRTYFYRKYERTTGKTHDRVETIHPGIIVRLLKQLDGDKVALRQHIDGFFAIGYENSSIEWFGTSGRFTEIELFLKEGKKPFYLTQKKATERKTQEVREARQERQGLSLDDMKKLMEGK